MIERKIRLSFLIYGIIVYSVGFLAFTYQQMPEYFNKDLISYDECTNAVVSNNIYRDFFPPRLRLNPLDPDYAGWKEGPDWQHIPPLSFYVPYPFYKLDGKTSIEVRRLSYVLLAYLQGLLFLIGISILFKQKRAIFISILATWLWLLTPFVRQTLNANAFGYSDIVLSFTVVLSVMMLLIYATFKFDKPKQKHNFFVATILAVTLPILTKNVLGALPLTMLLGYLFYNRDKEENFTKDISYAIFIPLLLCVLYFGACWWKSPEAFTAEFFVSFQHFGNYEGWAKPFYYYITNYLPRRYLGYMFFPFVIGLIYSIHLWRQKDYGEKKLITGVFMAYFFVVLVIISLVTSKSANFLLQGYLFILFFVMYMMVNKLAESIPGVRFNRLIEWMYEIRVQVFAVSLVVLGIFAYLNVTSMYEMRYGNYRYETPNQRYFEFGELCDRYLYADKHSIFILDTDTLQYPESLVHEDPDYWLRYYILFNSGSEARRLEEVIKYGETNDVFTRLRTRYTKIYWVASREVIEAKYPKYKSRFQALGKYYILPLKKNEVEELL